MGNMVSLFMFCLFFVSYFAFLLHLCAVHFLVEKHALLDLGGVHPPVRDLKFAARRSPLADSPLAARRSPLAAHRSPLVILDLKIWYVFACRFKARGASKMGSMRPADTGLGLRVQHEGCRYLFRA